MTDYDGVSKMAMELIYGTDEQKAQTVKMLSQTGIDEMENILEVCREVAFDNSGDEKLYFAVNCLIDYIYLTLGIRAMKNRP